MEIVYTDLDEVLHDYRNAFFKTLEGVVGDEIDITTLPSEQDLKPHFEEEYGMSAKDFDDIIEFLNNLTFWCPTVFSKFIIDFLNTMMDNGKKVVVVTARTSRRGAREIVNQIFGKDIPIIGCDAQHKKYAITGDCVFFEDRADTARSVVIKNPSALVIVPKWPWNLNIKKEDDWEVKLTDQQSERIWHTQQWEFDEKIKLIKDFKNVS